MPIRNVESLPLPGNTYVLRPSAMSSPFYSYEKSLEMLPHDQHHFGEASQPLLDEGNRSISSIYTLPLPSSYNSIRSTSRILDEAAGLNRAAAIHKHPEYGTGFWILWGGILLLATAISLDVQTVPQFQSYALSALGGSAWLASFSGIGNFVNATARPPIARLATRYGNFRLFSGLVLCLILGFICSAYTDSIVLFAIGQCLAALGQVGIQFATAIIVAENSALPNRALATALPMSPFAFTVFAVAPISEALLPDNWRLGYVIWTIIVPVAAVPLLLHLYFVRQSQGLHAQLYHTSKPLTASMIAAADVVEQGQLDVFGLILFAVSLSLVFFSAAPAHLSLAQRLQPPSLLLGCTLIVAFAYHQIYVAETPILDLRLLCNRTVCAGSLVTFLYFFSFSLYQPYLFPYLLIAENLSIGSATNASLIFMFASIIFGLTASYLLKITCRYKWIATTGTFMRLLGSILMLSLTSPETGKWSTYIYQAFAGAGMGIGSWVVQIGVQAAVAQKQIPALLALYATMGSLGGFFGDVMSSRIFLPTITKHLLDLLPKSLNSPHMVEKLTGSVLFALKFQRGTEERYAIDVAWALTMRLVHFWSTTVLLCACGVVWLMRDLRLDEDNLEEGNSSEISTI